MLAFELGIHRPTVWRQLEPLVVRGLVDHRVHKMALNGKTRNDGTLWAVRLTPNKGKRVRLSHEEMKHPWRDLGADIKRGRTAYKAM